ncbi:thaumatin-like protein 3 [Actinidia rufa]|uniref:Thaumatin-like protein 3 n=1 Tax=Actinidia rufa TaxID=165716 RepID=A0A7J0GHT6_9ERIC|nr:thaumatin-like protein 3 [Actinidia rufa]
MLFIIDDPNFAGTTVSATVFTLQNSCTYTVWPGTLTGDGGPALGDGGFALAPGASTQLPAPPGWSGRFWGRTGCIFNDAGSGTCATGDCGGLRCSGGGVPPVTLAEFTLASAGGQNMDFYDVSLVDGYNVGMGVRPSVGGTGHCQYAGCVADLNGNCPPELSLTIGGAVVACKERVRGVQYTGVLLHRRSLHAGDVFADALLGDVQERVPHGL